MDDTGCLSSRAGFKSISSSTLSSNIENSTRLKWYPYTCVCHRFSKCS